MKKQFLIAFAMLIIISVKAQDNILFVRQIDSVFTNTSSKDLDEVFVELSRLKNFFDTVNIQTINKDIFMLNVKSINYLNDKIKGSLSRKKDEILRTTNSYNKDYESKLKVANSTISELQTRIKLISESKNELLAKELTKYWISNDSLKKENIRLDSLYHNYYSKSNVYDTAIIANKVLRQQIAIYNESVVDWGVAATGFYDPKGVFYYEVNNDSTVRESTTDGYGGMLSFVLTFRLAQLKQKNTELYGIVNMPILDFSSISGTSIFNKKTPIGLGIGFRTGPVLASFIFNLTSVQRLTKGKRESKTFTAETPYEKIDLGNYSNYVVNEPSLLINVGVVIPIGYMIKANKAAKLKPEQ